MYTHSHTYITSRVKRSHHFRAEKGSKKIEKAKARLIHFFIVHLGAPRLTLGHCQLFPPERGEEEHEKYIFLLKTVLRKNYF